MYDDLNRLTALTNASGSSAYAYDSVGNMLTNQEAGSGSYTYGTIRPDAVRTASGAWFTYDQNGNIVFCTRQRLDYDVNNRLYRVIGTNGVVTTFGYDADGARLWEQSGTNSLQVWIDGNYEEKSGQILFHIDAANRSVCTFDATGTNVYEYYHPDNLTSTAIQTDQHGNEIQNYGYSAFGQSRYTQSASVFKVSRRYTGQVLDDATGLYFYNARYYDPQLGRFTQPDDTIPDFSNPQTYNRYVYCVNNPLRYTDPSGNVPNDWANSWAGAVDVAADAYSAGPSHWIWNGTVGTADSLIGGLGEPLRFGSSAGTVSGDPNATKGQIAIAGVQEISRAASIVPVATAAGKITGTIISTISKTAAKDGVGELGSQLGAAGTKTPPHFSGTDKPWTKGATPNSIYTHIDPKTGKAVQNAIYDSNGKVKGHVDFKNHGPGAPSGHGHTFPEPGNPASGHGPGKPHIPNNQLPKGWDKLPAGVQPKTPIGQ